MRAAVVALTGVVALTAATAGAGAAATAPAGYKIVVGALTPAPSSPFDSGADTACPSGTVVWGGGARLAGTGRSGESLETTDPAGSAGWNALVNNTSGAAESFSVNAICAAKPTGYKVVTASASNPAGAQTTVSVTCPAKTVVLSAGSFSSSDSSAERLTALWPASKTKVTMRMVNQTGSAATVEAEAVCGKQPSKYTIVKIAGSVPANTSDESGPSCPAGTAVLGGGINPATPGASFSINALTPSDRHTWTVGSFNASAATVTYTGYAICAA